MLHRIDNTTSSLPAEEAQELRRLLSGVAAGNRDDLAQLYRRTRTAVYGLALSYLRNAHDAQDLTQDVYVHIWDTADRYRPTGSPIGWVLRRADRQVTMEDREWYAIPDDGPGLDAQERLLLQDALAILGDEERRIVLLHTAGLKHREIGQALGLPLATVLSKYHRALKKMRAYMEGDDAR